MKKETNIQALAAISITLNEPDAGQIENVKKPPMMPGSTTGNLCLCGGITHGAIGDYLQAVYFTNVQGQNQVIDPKSVLNSPYSKQVSQSLNAAVTWTHNAAIPVFQGPSGSETWNTLRATAAIYRPGPMGMTLVDPPPSDIVSFKGLGVDNCPAAATASSVAGSTSVTFAPSFASPNDRSPADRDGDWWLYRGLSVSGFGRGSRLMLHGQPLQAKTLAFAAANVHWQRGQVRTTEISRAAGESVIASGPFVFFAGAPLSCLVVWQIGNPPTKSVIASECRQAPDIKHLTADDEVYVQVNFDFNDFTSRTGSFDLWVKIID